jgi:hypothetical protein
MTIDIADPEAFHAAWKAQEKEGMVDSEGGSQWRYEVAFAVLLHLGIEVPEDAQSPTWPTAEWLEAVIWYAQMVDR